MELVASFTDAWIETCKVPKRWIIASVASFTDAWIETGELIETITALLVASFTDAWIETSIIDAVVSEYQSHLLQMRGLKPTSCVYHSSLFSRIFYRCVD